MAIPYLHNSPILDLQLPRANPPLCRLSKIMSGLVSTVCGRLSGGTGFVSAKRAECREPPVAEVATSGTSARDG